MQRFSILGLLVLAGCTDKGAPLSAATPRGNSARPVASGGCIAGCSPTNSMEYGGCALRCAQAEVGSLAPVQILSAGDAVAQAALEAAGVTLDARSESFQIVAGEGGTAV